MGWRILAGVALAAACIGCGGGDGGGEQTVTIPSFATLDGQIGALAGASSTLLFATVGDDATNQEVRGFLIFDLSVIPAGVTVVQAVLDTNQFATTGTPTADLGPVVLDLVDIETSLDAGDFGAAAAQSAFTVLSTSDMDGLRQAEVGAQAADVLAAGGMRLDLRVRCQAPTDNDSTIDFLRFPTGENSTPSTLVVTFRP